MSEPFVRLTGIAAALPMDNVDTDLIWPAGPGVSLRRGAQAANAFATLRFDGNGVPRPDFVLNRAPWDRARILVAGSNFGCGSSREMAVWSLHEWGLRCVIAPSFGDIFYNNAALNGLLPVVLPEPVVRHLLVTVSDPAQCMLTVDLERCRVSGAGIDEPFRIDAHRRECLLRGLDETGRTLENMLDVFVFGARYGCAHPWTKRTTRSTGDREC